MDENPYQSPPREASPPDDDRRTPPTREARLVVLGVLLSASLIVSRILHAGDLYSLFVASIPIFLLSIVSYYFGLRHGAT